MKVGDKVVTVLGSGKVVDYHSSRNLWAVDLDGYIGREWFSEDEIEKED